MTKPCCTIIAERAQRNYSLLFSGRRIYGWNFFWCTYPTTGTCQEENSPDQRRESCGPERRRDGEQLPRKLTCRPPTYMCKHVRIFRVTIKYAACRRCKMFALWAEFLSWKRVSYSMDRSLLILIEQLAAKKKYSEIILRKMFKFVTYHVDINLREPYCWLNSLLLAQCQIEHDKKLCDLSVINWNRTCFQP